MTIKIDLRILFFIVFALPIIAGAQNTWIADNRPGAPSGDFVATTLQAAIDSASNGDIIHVIPSNTNYGSVTITKELTIYGIGFNPDKDGPQRANCTNIFLNQGANNTRISGLNVTSILYFNNSSGSYSLSNISIENAEISRIFDSSGSTRFVSNVIIRNCIIGRSEFTNTDIIDFNLTNASSIILTNNVINGSRSTSTNVAGSISISGAIIKNNLFLGDGGSNRYAFENVTNSTISNNIFYGRSPEGRTTLSQNIFNSNLSFGTVNDSLPAAGTGSGNTGDGLNQQGVDPLCVNVPIADQWLYTFDPTLTASSPAAGTGSDGTDIGITGSTIPFSTTGTPLPFIKVLNTSEVIKQGDDLQINVTAVGN